MAARCQPPRRLYSYQRLKKHKNGNGIEKRNAVKTSNPAGDIPPPGIVIPVNRKRFPRMLLISILLAAIMVRISIMVKTAFDRAASFDLYALMNGITYLIFL